MKRKIIVFPASQWQCDLIKYLKRINYFVYSLDDDNNAIGHNFSSKRLNINSKEIKITNEIYFATQRFHSLFQNREFQGTGI